MDVHVGQPGHAQRLAEGRHVRVLARWPHGAHEPIEPYRGSPRVCRAPAGRPDRASPRSFRPGARDQPGFDQGAQAPAARNLMAAGRRLIFTKGRDSHDYKFSSAALEDFYHVTPHWRPRFLATSMFNLKGAADRDNDLIRRTRAALANG